MFFALKKVYADGTPEQIPVSCVAVNKSYALELLGKKLGVHLSLAGSGAPDFLLEQHNESNVARVVNPTTPVYIVTLDQAPLVAPPL